MDQTVAVKLTDLRRRILENEQKGREAHFGISPEEYRECIDALRGNRAIAGAKGGKASGAAKGPKAKKEKKASTNLANLLADLGD